MRFIHTADWHLGRNFHGLQLTEEQRYIIMNELLPLIAEENIRTLVIAGDIYDRAVPPVEAMELFSEVLERLREMDVMVLYIAGNHDSGRRLQFAKHLLPDSGIFVEGELLPAPLPLATADEYGPIYFSLLPYADPAAVRQCYHIEETLDFASATEVMVREARRGIPAGARSVAIAHAFIAGGMTSDSERPLSVGGAANASPRIFADYSYTALGHLHNPQRAGADNIRYSGSLLKYSFDEAEQKKGVNIVDIDGAGNATVRFVELKPRREVRRIKGAYDDIVAGRGFEATDDFVEVVLTDKVTILGAFSGLKMRYPNLMNLVYERLDTHPEEWAASGAQELKRTSALDLFAKYYEQLMKTPLAAEQREIVQECIAEVDREEANR